MKSIQQKINEELKKIKEIPPMPAIKEDSQDSICLGDDNSIDNISSYSLADDWIIQPLDISNISPLLNSITLNGPGGSSTLNIGASGSHGSSGMGGAGLYQSGIYTTSPLNTSYNWNTLNQPNKVHITGSGIEMDADADITIGGRSMKKILAGIEQRLGILVPDPKKLERYEALQKAYEHYRTLEALCNEEPDTEDKQ